MAFTILFETKKSLNVGWFVIINLFKWQLRKTLFSRMEKPKSFLNEISFVHLDEKIFRAKAEREENLCKIPFWPFCKLKYEIKTYLIIELITSFCFHFSAFYSISSFFNLHFL